MVLKKHSIETGGESRLYFPGPLIIFCRVILSKGKPLSQKVFICAGGIVSALLFSVVAGAEVPVESPPQKETQGEEKSTAETSTGEPSTEETVPDGQCASPCSAEQVCRGGECVSPCADPCADGAVCTRNGHCVSKQPPVQGAQWRVPSRPYPPQVVGGFDGGRPRNGDFVNRSMYEKYEKKKNTGVGLMTFGIVLIVGAIGLGAAAGATGEPAFLAAGISVELLGNLLFFPGLAMTIRGNVGMAKAQKGYQAEGPRFDIHPLASLDTTRDGPSGRTWGLGLSFAL